MGLGKSPQPMRNSILLLLVRLSFTTSTKYGGFSLLDTSKSSLLVPRGSHLVELSPTFSTRGLRLLTHRFPTRIIRGSPELFAFANPSRIRIPSTLAHEHTLSWKVACLCECEDRGASPTLTVFVDHSFQILSTIIHRLYTIDSWLIIRWPYQQLVDWSKSLSTIDS
jgi:hypothetical protein